MLDVELRMSVYVKGYVLLFPRRFHITMEVYLAYIVGTQCILAYSNILIADPRHSHDKLRRKVKEAIIFRHDQTSLYYPVSKSRIFHPSELTLHVRLKHRKLRFRKGEPCA